MKKACDFSFKVKDLKEKRDVAMYHLCAAFVNDFTEEMYNKSTADTEYFTLRIPEGHDELLITKLLVDNGFSVVENKVFFDEEIMKKYL